MTDIVIDTCTLKHAEDPKSQYFEHSLEFIQKMLANQLKCIVDKDFTLEESSNRSYIGLEYIKHLQPGTLGYTLITFLAANFRIEFVSNSIPTAKKNYIEQKIRNKKDRMFLRIAFNSTDKVLASHDFTDYQKSKRVQIKKDLKILIVTAEEVNVNL